MSELLDYDMPPEADWDPHGSPSTRLPPRPAARPPSRPSSAPRQRTPSVRFGEAATEPPVEATHWKQPGRYTVLADRLDVGPEVLERAGLTTIETLGESSPLIDLAVQLGPSDPEASAAALGAALLSHAQRESDERLAVALTMLAPLIARSDARLLLGPEGRELRRELLPNGWKNAIRSWERMRYAWREGLYQLLSLHPEHDRTIVHALNEITRLNPKEAESVKVAIQEVWPPKKAQTAITLAGMAFTIWGIMREIRASKRR